MSKKKTLGANKINARKKMSKSRDQTNNKNEQLMNTKN